MPHRIRLKPTRYSTAGRADARYCLNVLARRLNARLHQLKACQRIDQRRIESFRSRLDRVTRIRRAMLLGD